MSVRGVFTALAIAALCAVSLVADEMPYELGTHGGFSGLTAGAEFDFIAAAAPISGVTKAGKSKPLTLGRFTLDRPAVSAAVPYSGNFNLSVTFNVPGGIQGSQNGLFSANLAGTMHRANGWVSLDFGPARTFSFSNPHGSGSFNFAVQGIKHFVKGPAGNPQPRLIGRISGADFTPGSSSSTPVPEPSTVLLLFSGALGMFFLRRKFSEG